MVRRALTADYGRVDTGSRSLVFGRGLVSDHLHGDADRQKWHTVIIHRLLENGPLGFNALEEEVDGISSKVLSDALDDLEEKRLVNREIVSEKPVRVEYSLTELGESLEPVIVEMRDWGANTSWQRLTRIVRSREPVVRTGSSRVTPPAGVPTGRPRSRRVGPPATRGKRGARRVPRGPRRRCIPAPLWRMSSGIRGRMWVSVNTPGNQRVARRGCPRAVTNASLGRPPSGTDRH